MSSSSGAWWSTTFRSAVAEAFGAAKELDTGARLARRTGLADPEMSPGSMVLRDPDGAWVAHLGVRKIDDGPWDALMQSLVADPPVAAAVITGELPIELHPVAVAVGCPLVPAARDLGADCTCPDWHEPCRHVGALVALVADMVELDPWLLAMLRGRSRDRIVQTIRSGRAGRLGIEPDSSGDTPRGVDLGVDAASAFGRTPEPLPAPLSGLRRPAEAVAFRSPPADAGVDMADLERLVTDAAARSFELLAGETDADALLIDPEDDQARIELSRGTRDP